MINLVPDTYKKKIIADYKKRRLLSFFIAFVVLWMSALVLLGVILIGLYWHKINLEELIGDQMATEDFKKKVLEIEKLTEKAEIVLEDQKSNWPVNTVWSLIEEVPTGINLEVIEFDLIGVEPKLELAGIFTTREVLQNWADVWEQKQGVVKVDIPLSSLIKETEGNFKLIVTLEEQVPNIFKL
ncbi:MAG: hypothetical protein ACOCU8_02925 [Patescibacteria group bacterium]